jgi:N-acetyl-gamma-glutamyl-phosphate reductase
VLGAARSFYAGPGFVRVTDKLGNPLQTKCATSLDLASVGYAADRERNMVLAMGVVDKLGKGAAAQEVENANLKCGLPETTGLDGVSD